MKTQYLIWIGVVLVMIAVGWYLFDMSPAEPEVVLLTDMGLNGAPNQTNTGQADIPAIVRVSADSTLGSYLVASNGMTLYMFTKDGPNVSTCYNACALNWPAYSPQGSEPVAPGDGVVGKLGSIGRTDGATQLTYNGMPLYFWHNDVKPGDTLGQNVGGTWFVVKP